ncbi:DNA polymerase III subunit delta' [Campylobacter corcagiensis]|uniref:DNA polymerase III subunit delta n=1 Tax=Campylobacter corcagiensis TaxID=1448857 RepID=A0A7M1LF29_9BACT|nr:DNA polymerase III subunit delta' [Campylobacter corcagiensis]QKF64889.1 DNA polymerase III, delta prime subunit [Campylobacter corcagiensis]QOQ86951.1 hypothetical protein IMC76_06985 [Campylobacter corcagiensis]
MNKIIISNNFDSVKAEILSQNKNSKFYENSEILIDDARSAIDEAYIAENSLKTIVLMGQKFRTEAQNALLLVLEDSPKNIEFILVGGSKSLFLPTIRSRLAIINRLEKVEIPKIDLNFKKLTLHDINTFLKEKVALEKKGDLSKEELLNLVHSVVKTSILQGVKFNTSELEYINKLFVLANLNTKARAILTPLLLMIGDKR